jgi:hypothetical protein
MLLRGSSRYRASGANVLHRACTFPLPSFDEQSYLPQSLLAWR